MFVPQGHVIHAYNMMKNGFLPNPGSWLDQPSTLIEAWSVLDYEEARKMKRDRERMRHG